MGKKGMDKLIYISGKIAGNADAKEEFAAAQAALKELGYSVYNPFEHFEGEWDLRCIMEGNLMALLACNYIYLLPNWYMSRGAAIEKALADYVGIKIFNKGIIETPQLAAHGV